jgi:hypothetical protein
MADIQFTDGGIKQIFYCHGHTQMHTLTHRETHRRIEAIRKRQRFGGQSQDSQYVNNGHSKCSEYVEESNT